MSESAPRDSIRTKARNRPGYAKLNARDPNDGKYWDVLISPGRLNWIKRVGGALVHETRLIVPTVLDKPTAIFQGLLSDDDEDKFGDVGGWLCYLGQPCYAYDDSGRPYPVREGLRYLIFLNAERVAYAWRFDQDDRLPASFDHRFKERLL